MLESCEDVFNFFEGCPLKFEEQHYNISYYKAYKDGLTLLGKFIEDSSEEMRKVLILINVTDENGNEVFCSPDYL